MSFRRISGGSGRQRRRSNARLGVSFAVVFAVLAITSVQTIPVASKDCCNCGGGGDRWTPRWKPGVAVKTLGAIVAIAMVVAVAFSKGYQRGATAFATRITSPSPQSRSSVAEDEKAFPHADKTWAEFCANLKRMDVAHKASGRFFDSGLDMARRALERVLQNVMGEYVPRDVNLNGAVTAKELLVANDARTQPGGRTRKTGEEHLMQLRELRPYNVLLLGDSHVERFARKPHGAEAFAQLEARCGRVFAAGVGGDAVDHLAWRLCEQQPLDKFTAPLRAVVVMIGSNDLLSSSPEGPFAGRPEAVAENTTALLRLLAKHPRARDAARFVLAIPPVLHDGADGVTLRATARRKYNDTLRFLAPTAGATFVDTFAALTPAVAALTMSSRVFSPESAPVAKTSRETGDSETHGLGQNVNDGRASSSALGGQAEALAALFGPDGVHLSPSGYAQFAQCLAEALRGVDSADELNADV